MQQLKSGNSVANYCEHKDVFERDENLLRCTDCQHSIGYDSNYDQMQCSHCGKLFRIHDIVSLMQADDETRTKLFEKKEKVTVSFEAGHDWRKDAAKDSVSFVTIKRSKGG